MSGAAGYEGDPLLRRLTRAMPARTDIVLAIAAGGALGGSMRWGLNLLVPPGESGFPYSTLVENVLGCSLLAVLTVYLTEVWQPGPYLRPFLGVGVLGGFTTFSTYTNDARQLILEGEAPLALTYYTLSLVAGLVAVLAGFALARRIAGTSADIS